MMKHSSRHAGKKLEWLLSENEKKSGEKYDWKLLEKDTLEIKRLRPDGTIRFAIRVHERELEFWIPGLKATSGDFVKLRIGHEDGKVQRSVSVIWYDPRSEATIDNELAMAGQRIHEAFEQIPLDEILSSREVRSFLESFKTPHGLPEPI